MVVHPTGGCVAAIAGWPAPPQPVSRAGMGALLPQGAEPQARKDMPLPHVSPPLCMSIQENCTFDTRLTHRTLA